MKKQINEDVNIDILGKRLNKIAHETRKKHPTIGCFIYLFDKRKSTDIPFVQEELKRYLETCKPKDWGVE